VKLDRDDHIHPPGPHDMHEQLHTGVVLTEAEKEANDRKMFCYSGALSSRLLLDLSFFDLNPWNLL